MNRKMQFFWITVVVLTLPVKPTVCFSRLRLEFGYSFNRSETVRINNGTDVMLVHVRNNYQTSEEHDIIYIVVLSISSSPFPSNSNSVNAVVRKRGAMK